jgi:hypothetical protein
MRRQLWVINLKWLEGSNCGHSYLLCYQLLEYWENRTRSRSGRPELGLVIKGRLSKKKTRAPATKSNDHWTNAYRIQCQLFNMHVEFQVPHMPVLAQHVECSWSHRKKRAFSLKRQSQQWGTVILLVVIFFRIVSDKVYVHNWISCHFQTKSRVLQVECKGFRRWCTTFRMTKMWVISFITLPLYHRGKSPGTHGIGDWLGSSVSLDNMENEILLTVPGIELQPSVFKSVASSCNRLHYRGSIFWAEC